jgi:mRNA interferase RelE/StbE
MSEITVSEARARLADVVDADRVGHDPVYLTRRGQRVAAELRTLDAAARRRVQAAIELLADHPRPSGANKLVGGDGEWRVRTGNYRIVHEIHDDVLLVLVVAFGHRRDIDQHRKWPLRSPHWKHARQVPVGGVPRLAVCLERAAASSPSEAP